MVYTLRMYTIMLMYGITYFYVMRYRVFTKDFSFSKVCHLSIASSRLYTRIASKALMASYSDVGERGVAVNCEKTQFFLNTK